MLQGSRSILNLSYSFCEISRHILCVGLLWVLRFPPTYQKHGRWYIEDTKLPLTVNVCMHGGLRGTVPYSHLDPGVTVIVTEAIWMNEAFQS